MRAAELRLSLDSAPAVALARNPALAAARLRIEEARGRLQGAGKLDNPELEFGYQQNVRSPENRISAQLFQRFPVTARLRLERAVTRAGLAAAEEEVRNEERKLAAEVRGLVVRLLALREQRALRDRQLANSRDLAGFLRQRAGVGEASSLDADLVDLETGGIAAEQLGLDVETATRLGELRPLAWRRPGGSDHARRNPAWSDRRHGSRRRCRSGAPTGFPCRPTPRRRRATGDRPRARQPLGGRRRRAEL